jgi:hypothetical protein
MSSYLTPTFTPFQSSGGICYPSSDYKAIMSQKGAAKKRSTRRSKSPARGRKMRGGSATGGNYSNDSLIPTTAGEDHYKAPSYEKPMNADFISKNLGAGYATAFGGAKKKKSRSKSPKRSSRKMHTSKRLAPGKAMHGGRAEVIQQIQMAIPGASVQNVKEEGVPQGYKNSVTIIQGPGGKSYEFAESVDGKSVIAHEVQANGQLSPDQVIPMNQLLQNMQGYFSNTNVVTPSVNASMSGPVAPIANAAAVNASAAMQTAQNVQANIYAMPPSTNTNIAAQMATTAYNNAAKAQRNAYASMNNGRITQANNAQQQAMGALQTANAAANMVAMAPGANVSPMAPTMNVSPMAPTMNVSPMPPTMNVSPMPPAMNVSPMPPQEGGKKKKRSSSKSKKTKKTSRKMRGGSATGFPAQYYDAKIPTPSYASDSGKGMMTAYGAANPKDVGVGMLAPYNASSNGPRASMVKTGGMRIPSMSDSAVKDVKGVIDKSFDGMDHFFKKVEDSYNKSVKSAENVKVGDQNLIHNGGKKKKATKKTTSSKKKTTKRRRSMKGGSGSDYATTLSSRGPVNAPDNYWGVDGEKFFRQFNKTGEYIPNSQLAVAAAPQSTTSGMTNGIVKGYDNFGQSWAPVGKY